MTYTQVMHHFGMGQVPVICWFYQIWVFPIWFDTVVQNICAVFFGPDSLSKKCSILFINWGTTVNAEVLHDMAKSLKLQSIGARGKTFPPRDGKLSLPGWESFPSVSYT